MRILQLSKFYSPVRGGIESVVQDLTEGLNQLGHRTDVLCANQTPRTIREAGNYNIVRAGSAGKLLSTSIAPRLIPELHKLQDEYDIIHVHLPDPMMNLALALCRPAAKVIVHWHSDVVNQQIALKFYAPLQSWLLKRADAIVATSSAYANSSPWLRPHRSKVRVIPLGAKSLGRNSAQAEVIKARFPGKKIVLALGRLVYYKGFEHLIRAAKDLPEDVHVLIGGEGDLFKVLQELVRAEGIGDRVTLLGRISRDMLVGVFSAADVF
jgi:glycosyltransferase involved in cell wall biosynthesis